MIIFKGYITILIYYDKKYREIKNSLPLYPFNGKRGKDFDKKELSSEASEDNYWVILGKNISKNGLVKVKNYDKYHSDTKYLLPKEIVAITQFGINLKAALVPAKSIASGGIVLVSHDGISQQEAIHYLNKPAVNEYLKRYSLNGAELTVHLDGKYLRQIPYTPLLN